MKRTFLISIFLLTVSMLFMSGCYYKSIYGQEYYECDDGTKVVDKSQCDAFEELKEMKDQLDEIRKYEPVAEPEDQAPAEDQEDSSDSALSPSNQAAELFSKFEKVKTIQFAYVYSVDLPNSIYYVSKDKIKISLEARFGVVNEKYDTVYLDLVSQKAAGYCENTDLDLCPDRDKQIEVSYEDFVIETPFDWVESIEGAELTGRSKTLENRNVVEVEFTRDGRKGTMFVDSFYGMPISITLGDNIYGFRDVLVNEAADEDLEHQFIE